MWHKKFVFLTIITCLTSYSYAKELILPFNKGERLTYEVRYKKLKVGESTLTFHGEKELGSKKIYHVTFSTKLPAIKDTEELYAEKDTFLPFKINRTIKKLGNFTMEIEENYNQDNFRVDISKKGKFLSKNFSIKKASNIHNSILLTYYYRTKDDFNEKDKFKIILPTTDFEVMFLGKEIVETPMGKQLAYAFSSNPLKFKLWLSADNKKIPLKIENPNIAGYSLVIKSIEP